MDKFTFRYTDGQVPTIAMFDGQLVAVIASLGFEYDEFECETYEKSDWFLFNDCMGTINMDMLKKAYTEFLENNWGKGE
jgi:hypothetical protein